MGGGSMSAAAKVAGITVATGGLRGITAENYSVSSAARRAAFVLPAAATTEDVKLVTSKFAGGEQEVMVSAAERMPRVVFGGVPTLQEAEEATSELAAALEKVYLSSPNSAGCEGSVVTYHDSSLPLPNSQVVKTKACVTSETAIAPALPAPAMMAFRFLQESSKAQNVVASIACDQNVWNAVLQNQELQEFLHSQRACSTVSDLNSNMELVADSDLPDPSFAKSINDSSQHAESEPVNGFMNIFQNIKSAVVDMMSSLSDYFQNFFGGKGANRVFANSDGTAKVSADTFMGASIMGLAVMAILVILLKRA